MNLQPGRRFRGEVIQINDSEKIVFMQKGSVMMDMDENSARSILCQAMMDETIRLRDCRRQRERDSIRRFLIESFQTLSSGIPNKHNSEMNLCDKPQ